MVECPRCFTALLVGILVAWLIGEALYPVVDYGHDGDDYANYKPPARHKQGDHEMSSLPRPGHRPKQRRYEVVRDPIHVADDDFGDSPSGGEDKKDAAAPEAEAPPHHHEEDPIPPAPFFFNNSDPDFLAVNNNWWRAPQFHATGDLLNTGKCPSMDSVLECNETVLVDANPEKGFHWQYLLHIPRLFLDQRAKSRRPTYPFRLLVVPNNARHDQLRMAKADVITNRVLAAELGVALLVPVFPRYEPQIPYSHVLDRQTVAWDRDGHRRFDLQLLAMVADAQDRILTRTGRRPDDRFIMVGFSASAAFSTRMAVLHPDRVLAVVAGGQMVFIPPLPEDHPQAIPDYANNYTYPVGAADLKELVGAPFDQRAFNRVHMLTWIGLEDPDDIFGVLDPQYSEEFKAALHSRFGYHNQKKRFAVTKQVYRDSGHERSLFALFPGIDHTFRPLPKAAAVQFLRPILEGKTMPAGGWPCPVGDYCV